MEKNLRKKDLLLGMPHGTACNKLRKSIIFHLAKKLDMLSCHRCGKKIENPDLMSIEHKISWESSDDPISTFFSIKNIAFSHLGCNSGSARRSNKKYSSSIERRNANREQWRRSKRKNYDPSKRSQKYRERGY